MLVRLAGICGLTLCSFAMSAFAQSDVSEPREDRMLVIYDSSNSMWGELADKSRKYEAGRTALTNFLGGDIRVDEIGFRAYGHRDKTDCRDSELVVPFANAATAKSEIGKAIASIRPTGKTPINFSLREGLKDFGGRGGDILLISDGIETCDADPCELMQEWQDSNVNIRVHVVGVGLTDIERGAMACIADTSGGKYFDADTAVEFDAALTEVSVAIEAPAAAPRNQTRGYALRISASDDQGRSYVAMGQLFLDGEEVGTVTSNGRNVLDGPGDYEFTLGAVLADGSIYEPVTQSVSVTEPGDTRLSVIVVRPAIVFATFTENGEERRGSGVTAYQDGTEVFRFRAADDALARPGEYEFRAQPNADNQLVLQEALPAGERTELVFDLISTVKFYVRFVLPNGETFKRGSELWRDGERLYKVFGSNNPTTVRPGFYELRADDQNLPLTPVEIEIPGDGETIDVPIDAGWVSIAYAPSDFDYVSEPDRAWLESVDRGGKKYARINTPIPVKPGRYRVNPHTARGSFDTIDIEVASNATVETVFKPKPLGEIIVNYAKSTHWSKPPDRASVSPLEGPQMFSGGFMRPGKAKKVVPGRYHVKGGGSGSDAAAQEIVVLPHETLTVTLQPPD